VGDSAALWVYLGIFGSLVAAGLGFPIPEEIPIVTAGVVAGHAAEPRIHDAVLVNTLAVAPDAGFPGAVPWAGLVLAAEFEPQPVNRVRWWILLPLCILGVVISDMLLYTIGRVWGFRVLTFPWMRRLLPLDRFQKIQNNFQKHGVLILLFARVLPGIRSPIFLTAGIMRLPLRRFLLADGIYAIPGVTLLFGLAFWFTDSFLDLFLRIKHQVDRARGVLILTLIAAAAAYLVVHFLRKPVPVGDPRELPILGEPMAATLEAVERKQQEHTADASIRLSSGEVPRPGNPSSHPPSGPVVQHRQAM